MNKKIFLILMITSIFPFVSINAQKRFPTEHSIGITAGMNMSKVSFQPSVAQDYKMGETFGFAYRYIEEKYFGIQAELMFTTRGWKDKLEDYPDYHFSRSFSYVELPIMSHIFFGNNRFRGFVNLGPSISYLVGSDKVVTNIDYSVENPFETEHHNLEISNRFDYGIIGGAGIELRFGRNFFLIEGRYYFGLGDLFPNEKKDYFEASASQYISVKATYLFKIGGK